MQPGWAPNWTTMVTEEEEQGRLNTQGIALENSLQQTPRESEV
jgi:hypothetical protein